MKTTDQKMTDMVLAMDARIRELEEENRGYEKRERAYIEQIEATAAPEPKNAQIRGALMAIIDMEGELGMTDTEFVRRSLYIANQAIDHSPTAAPEPELAWTKTEDKEPPLYETIIGYYLREPDNIYMFTTRVPDGYGGAGTQHTPDYWAKLNPPVRNAGGG